MGVAVLGVITAFAWSPVLVADAQTNEGPVTTQCLVTSMDPAVVPAGGADITVSGTAPGGVGPVHIQLFVNGVSKDSDDVAAGAQFSLSASVHAGDRITVGWTTTGGSAYTGGCQDPSGHSEFIVQLAGEQAQRAAALAFTGSSNTPSYVLIGVAAVALGTVLVIAGRRRRRVSTGPRQP
jgi:LPXTG-motif cell wall-anchored protein